MKSSTFLLIAGGAFAAAGGFAYWRGARGRELAAQTVTHGLVLGSGLAVTAWLVGQGQSPVPAPVPVAAAPRPQTSLLSDALALTNSISHMAKIGQDATRLLTQIDPEQLYRPIESAAMRIAAVPENEYSVNQKA